MRWSRIVPVLVMFLTACSEAGTVFDPISQPMPSTKTITGQICWGPVDGNSCRRETPFGPNPRHHSGRNSYEDLYETVKESPDAFCTTMEGERVDCLRVPLYANGARTITDSIGRFSFTVSTEIDSITFSMDEDELPMRFFAWEGARSNCVYEKLSECNSSLNNNQVYTFLNYIVEDVTIKSRQRGNSLRDFCEHGDVSYKRR